MTEEKCPLEYPTCTREDCRYWNIISDCRYTRMTKAKAKQRRINEAVANVRMDSSSLKGQSE